MDELKRNGRPEVIVLHLTRDEFRQILRAELANVVREMSGELNRALIEVFAAAVGPTEG